MNSFYDGEGNNIVIESEMNASVLDYLTDAFSTAICIGDSVTEGVGSVSDYTKIKNYSYPIRLAKMRNISPLQKAVLTLKTNTALTPMPECTSPSQRMVRRFASADIGLVKRFIS